MRINKILAKAAIFAAMMFGLSGTISAQELKTKEDYVSRYNLLVSRFGANGVGIETLLDKWESAFPEDLDMLEAKFAYYYTSCRVSQTIDLPQPKYLGQAPVVALKDSLGVSHNYFEDYIYDEETFGKAVSYLDKAIQTYQNRLDLRFIKAAAYLEYEKESPDMTLSFLKGLADYNGQSHPKWEYPEYDSVSADDFISFMQDYCGSFYQLGTPSGWEAFKSLSEKMLQYYPKNTLFMTNIGTYYFAYKKDNKAALKQYNAVLKIKPDDYTAIKNCVLLARSQKDVKLQKKYLPMLVKYSPDETEKTQAQAMLSALK